MKTKILLILCFIYIINTKVLFSQITITFSDYQNLKGTSQTTEFYLSGDTSGVKNMLSRRGANITWDISNKPV